VDRSGNAVLLDNPSNVVDVLEQTLRDGSRNTYDIFLYISSSQYSLFDVMADSQKLAFIIYSLLTETLRCCQGAVLVVLKVIHCNETDVVVQLTVASARFVPDSNADILDVFSLDNPAATLSKAPDPSATRGSVLAVTLETLRLLNGDLTQRDDGYGYQAHLKLKRHKKDRVPYSPWVFCDPQRVRFVLHTTDLHLYRMLLYHLQQWIPECYMRLCQHAELHPVELDGNTFRVVLLYDEGMSVPNGLDDPTAFPQVTLVALRGTWSDGDGGRYCVCLRKPVLPSAWRDVVRLLTAVNGSEKYIDIVKTLDHNEIRIKLRSVPLISQSLSRPMKSAHILVVDDVKLNLDIMKRILENMQHTWEVALNGEEAVQKVVRSYRWGHSRSNFDLVLMDIQMPVMNGFVATQRIRDHERHLQREHNFSTTPYLPVVAMTGHVPDQAFMDKAANCGQKYVIPKPVKLKALEKCVSAVLSQKSEKDNGEDHRNSVSFGSLLFTPVIPFEVEEK